MSAFPQLCQMGFKCPHLGISDDWDDICIHPYTEDDCPEDECFCDMDSMCGCPLVECCSELEKIIFVFHHKREEFNEFIEIQGKRLDREGRRSSNVVEFKERVATRALDGFWKLTDNCEFSTELAGSADALKTNLSQTLKEDTQ